MTQLIPGKMYTMKMSVSLHSCPKSELIELAGKTIAEDSPFMVLERVVVGRFESVSYRVLAADMVGYIWWDEDLFEPWPHSSKTTPSGHPDGSDVAFLGRDGS